MQIFLLTIATILYIIGFSFIIPLILGITPPIPSMPSINNLLISKIKQYDNTQGDILDIGSGYGSCTFALAKAFPHRQIIACDISFFPLLFSKITSFLLRYHNIKFIKTDGFGYALSHPEITSIFSYIIMTPTVKSQFKKLVPSFRGYLFLNTYPLEATSTLESIKAHDLFNSCLYIYHQPKGTNNV